MKQKTWYIRFYGVIAKKQTYKNILYLFLSFPLSILYFVLVITGVCVGAGLVPVFLGIFILTGALLAVFGFYLIEQRLVGLFFNENPAQVKLKTSSGGFWKRIRSILTDSLLWNGVFYFWIKLFLSTFTFAFATALLSASVTLTFLPLFLQIRRGDELDVYIERAWNYPLVIIGAIMAGILLAFISLHAVNGLARLHKRLTVFMIRR